VNCVDPLPSLPDDGLVTPIVGDWAEDKYQLAKCYASIFAGAMKRQWECLVYVDLFSGAGRARIGNERGRVVPATPLLVLDTPHPFTKYIFCELDPAKLCALERRVATAFPERDVLFVEGDCNVRIDEIVGLIPRFSKSYRVLTFCLVDPYNIGSLSFKTIERLSHNRRIDFLVLIASGMDANRNRDLYTKPDHPAVDRFIGTEDWRSRWSTSRLSFGDFVADEFGHAMSRLGYVYDGLSSLQLVRSTEKNLALYHLGVFSKHPLGAEFWQKCRQSANPQRSLPGFM
jgi:three-Cys-motif partner protein